MSDHYEHKYLSLKQATENLIIELGVSPAALKAIADNQTSGRVSRKVATDLLNQGVFETKQAPAPLPPSALPKGFENEFLVHRTALTQNFRDNGYVPVLVLPGDLTIFRKGPAS